MKILFLSVLLLISVEAFSQSIDINKIVNGGDVDTTEQIRKNNERERTQFQNSEVQRHALEPKQVNCQSYKIGDVVHTQCN